MLFRNRPHMRLYSSSVSYFSLKRYLKSSDISINVTCHTTGTNGNTGKKNCWLLSGDRYNTSKMPSSSTVLVLVSAGNRDKASGIIFVLPAFCLNSILKIVRYCDAFTNFKLNLSILLKFNVFCREIKTVAEWSV